MRISIRWDCEQDKVADLDPVFPRSAEQTSRPFNVGSFASGKETRNSASYWKPQANLRPDWCRVAHITSTEEKRWIQQRIESGRDFHSEEKKRFAERPPLKA